MWMLEGICVDMYVCAGNSPMMLMLMRQRFVMLAGLEVWALEEREGLWDIASIVSAVILVTHLFCPDFLLP